MKSNDQDVSDLYIPALPAMAQITVSMAVYRKATGEIVQVLRQSPDLAEHLATGELGVAEIPGDGVDLTQGFAAAMAFMAGHYIDGRGLYPMLKERLACPAVLDGRTLRGLPLPCTIEITAPGDVARTYDEADSDTLEISLDHADEYTITVLSVRYLPGVYHLNTAEK